MERFFFIVKLPTEFTLESQLHSNIEIAKSSKWRISIGGEHQYNAVWLNSICEQLFSKLADDTSVIGQFRAP